MKFDHYLMRALSVGAALAAGYCIMWAAAILLFQVLGWLRFGEWQPVPTFALLVSDVGQAEIRAFAAPVQGLNLVPAWGTAAWNGDGVAAELGGELLGMRKVFAWLLDGPLVVWLIASALLLLFACIAAAQEARTSVPTKAAM
jgi:hypothetical protein